MRICRVDENEKDPHIEYYHVNLSGQRKWCYYRVEGDEYSKEEASNLVKKLEAESSYYRYFTE